MTDWDQGRSRRFERGADGRDGSDWRNAASTDRADRPTGSVRDRFDALERQRDDRSPPSSRRPSEDRSFAFEQQPGPYPAAGGAARGYGMGGDNAYGQIARGSSDSGLGGYGGADVGGWGQPNLNSQWGQGGYAPLNQGLDYGQDGGRFGPAGYDTGDFGQHRSPTSRPEPSPHHDEHHVHYRTWRDARLASHDRDYSRWRDEQVRRYDEDYGSWRQERHAAFSKEFEGWRAGRGGQATPGASPFTSSDRTPEAEPTTPPQAAGSAHGANPTLAKIAEGREGRADHPHEEASANGRTPGPQS